MRIKNVFCSLLLITAISVAIYFYPNFRAVIPDTIYRSAQLSSIEYRYYVHHYHIQSVLNLRGAQDSAWYRQEIKDSQRLHIQHYDLYLDSHSLTSSANLLTLAQLLDTAPKPLLIHCWRGADRTGFVSAMAIILLDDELTPLNKALSEISIWYGVISPYSIGYLEFKAYKQWLRDNHRLHSKANFIEWLHYGAA